MSDDNRLDSSRISEIGEFARNRIEAEPGMADITPVELLALTEEVGDLRSENRRLQQSIEVLEGFRPHWAKGYTDDSVAAQTYMTATMGMWEALGVGNQTEAIQAIKDLIAFKEEHESTSPTP